MKNNLRETTKKSLAVVSAIMGMSVLFAACSSTDDNRVSGGVSEDAGFVADVAGVAQKGPFVKGSAVTVRGINCKTLEFTDQVFESSIKSDKGDFAFDSVALDTSCAVIEVTGKYLNEVTGKKTKNELTLRALTNLKNRGNVNVNVLTNLEYERVMYLVKEKNKSLAKAKTQAENEVLAAFDIKDEVGDFENLNIFEAGNGNAALLAVSVMMQGDADVDGLAKRLDKFEDSFAESGKWKDSETKKAITEWVAEASENGKLETIRKNIEGLDYADEIPAFEKYIPTVVSDTVEDVSSSSEDSSSSVEQDSLEEAVSSSSKEESSSSEVVTDSVSSSSVAPDTSVAISSSSIADSSGVETVRDTSARDTSVRDSSVRDTSVRDTGSVKQDSSIAVKDSACTDTKFPHELSYLLGSSYEVLEARCVRDSVVVEWRTRHEIYEKEDSTSGVHVFSATYEQYVTDSLNAFRAEWLDEGYGYDAYGYRDLSRDGLVSDVYGYSYQDTGINASLRAIGETTPVYTYRMDLKNASYLVYVFSVPKVSNANGVRTIHYGFEVELMAIYVPSTK